MFVCPCPYLPFSAQVTVNKHRGWPPEGIEFQQCSNTVLTEGQAPMLKLRSDPRPPGRGSASRRFIGAQSARSRECAAYGVVVVVVLSYVVVAGGGGGRGAVVTVLDSLRLR